MARAFVAVVPPPVAVDEVVRWRAQLPTDERLRWSDSSQWHLTLRFFSDADIDAVADALGALDHPAGWIALGGGGAFPRPHRGTTLWVGVRDGLVWLQGLAGAVASIVAPVAGDEGRERATDQPYRAHLTLARARRPG